MTLKKIDGFTALYTSFDVLFSLYAACGRFSVNYSVRGLHTPIL